MCEKCGAIMIDTSRGYATGCEHYPLPVSGRRRESVCGDTDDKLPLVACPKCGKVEEDFDGFGVLYCGACGYCTHPAIQDGVCDLCLRGINDSSESEQADSVCEDTDQYDCPTHGLQDGPGCPRC